MQEINLSSIPGLKGMRIIQNQNELETFLASLRQDRYSPEKLAELGLTKELENWLASKESNTITFFVVYDEKDCFANDNSGHYELFRYIAIRSVDGKTHLFKNSMEKFKH